jgi:hypothetical protein
VTVSYKLILNRLVNELPRFAYNYADERQLHEGLAAVLTSAGIRFDREYIAGPKDRFDFLCDEGVVIEAKIKGTFSEALRQIDRYCARDDVKAVLLVTTCLWGQARGWRDDAVLHTKPVRMVRIGRQAF